MLFFTKKGRCYWLKAYDIPEGNKASKGRAIQNMLNIEPDDAVNACLYVRKLNDPEFNATHNVIFCTKNGTIKKTSLADYSRPRTNGVNAINIVEGDRVVDVALTNGNNEIVIASKMGRAVRFNETAVRTMGRVATGVRGITLEGEGNEVVGMVVVDKPEEETILVVSEKGYGKRSDVTDYRVTNRGGKGVKTLEVTEKTGLLTAIKSVTNDEDLMIINKSGITLRLKLEKIKIQGRATQGVKLIELQKRNDTIANVCVVPSEEDEESLPEEARASELPEPTQMSDGQTITLDRDDQQ